MFKKVIGIQVLFAMIHALTAHASDAPRHCNPEKSKPCGMSCIRKEFTCHKPAGGPNAAVAGVAKK